MGTTGHAMEAFRAGKKIFGQGQEYYGKAKPHIDRGRELHGQLEDVKQVAAKNGVPLPSAKDLSSRSGAKRAARAGLCGAWGLVKREAKKYITYVLSLLVFAFIVFVLVCFLIAVLSHHSHLQLFTLTTRGPATINMTKGDNLMTTAGEVVDYRIYLLNYCVSGLTEKSEKQLKITNGCHHSKQALYEYILPALNSTFTDPLPQKEDIQSLFKHYGYASFGLYIFNIIVLPFVAGGFIWWFISTLKPWNRTFTTVVCFFAFTLFIPAVLQTVLVFRVIHILKHDIDLTKSSLQITFKHGSLYIFLTHFFWCILILNLVLFRIIDCLRDKRKARKERRGQGTYEAQNSQDSAGSIHESHGVVDNTLYDSQSFEMKPMPPKKESFPRKLVPTNTKYDNGDQGDGSLRYDPAYADQKQGVVYKEKERFNNV